MHGPRSAGTQHSQRLYQLNEHPYDSPKTEPDRSFHEPGRRAPSTGRSRRCPSARDRSAPVMSGRWTTTAEATSFRQGTGSKRTPAVQTPGMLPGRVPRSHPALELATCRGNQASEGGGSPSSPLPARHRHSLAFGCTVSASN